MSRFSARFGAELPVIGTIRLPPLPDRPGSPGLADLIAFATSEFESLRDGGADGVLIVNENDVPHRIRAQPETISAMNRIARTVSDMARDLPVGCQILVNDPIASLAVARTAGLDFVRCDYFVDPMERPGHGPMALDPDGLMAYRREIDAEHILVLADIQVKHATMLEERSLRESARRAALHLADAVIVTGPETGSAPDRSDLEDALAGIADSGLDVPLLLGGGLAADNAELLLALADGAIVGTGVSSNERIDRREVEMLMEVVARLRGCRHRGTSDGPEGKGD